MDAIKYKGYRGAVRYSAEDRLLHGRILGIDDVVNFEGDDVEKLEKAFREAVDDYLALCEKLGRAPDREYSGRIPLRIDGALHRSVAIAADAEAKSVNSWIADALEAATTPGQPDAPAKKVAAYGARTFPGRRSTAKKSKRRAVRKAAR